MNTTLKATKLLITVTVLGALITACDRRTDTADSSAAAPGAATGSGSMASSSAMPPSDATMTKAPESTASSSRSVDSSGASASSAAAGAGDKAEAKAERAGDKAKAGADKAGSVIDDSMITGKVKAALLADEKVKGLDINVETKKDEVMLSGFVESQSQIDSAVKIAKNIEGVKKVTNKLSVKK